MRRFQLLKKKINKGLTYSKGKGRNNYSLNFKKELSVYYFLLREGGKNIKNLKKVKNNFLCFLYIFLKIFCYFSAIYLFSVDFLLFSKLANLKENFIIKVDTTRYLFRE
jgi:hypothetical protein